MMLMETHHQVERINDCLVNLGRMPVEALVQMRGHCEERLVRTEQDISKIDAELGYRNAPDNVYPLFPTEPQAA